MKKRVSDRETKEPYRTDTDTLVRPSKHNPNELDIAVHSSNTRVPPNLSG